MILNKFKNYFNKFLSSKFIFYSNIDKPKGNILFVDRERADTGIANSILALAVSKKYKMNVLILTDSKLDSTIMKIYRQLGFTNFLIGVSQYQKIKYFNTFLYSIFLSLIGIFNIYKKGFIWFINKYSINNVLIGDLIYDTNIRILNRFQNPKIDLYFIKILIKSTFRTLIIKNHFKKYNIKKVIVGTEVYSFNSGIALRLAVYNKNIKNYTIVGNHIGDLQILNYK